MKTWLKKHWKRYMLRPLIYKTFTRFVLALTVALLWDNYVRLEDVYKRQVNGLTVTLVFSEYDVDSYVATMDGRSLLVSADEVDKLVRTVKQGA